MISDRCLDQICSKLNWRDANELQDHLTDRVSVGEHPIGSVEVRTWELFARFAHDGGYIIYDDSKDPYLLRLYLTPHAEDVPGKLVKPRKWPALFGHYFFRGDNDRDYHNHPWKKSLSFVATAGYTEERLVNDGRAVHSRIISPGSFNYLSGDTFHRVTLHAGPALTLFLAGPKKATNVRGEDWGFFDPKTKTYEPWMARTIRTRQGKAQ